MNNKEKLKVVFICHTSNPDIRIHLHLTNYKLENFIRRLFGKKQKEYVDNSRWSTLLFQEFEKIDDIELHPIILHPGMKRQMESFEIEGIHYHCIKQQSDRVEWIFNRSADIREHYKYNRRRALKAIEEVRPDVIILQGAECPFISSIGLDIDTTKYPFFLAMQTGLSDPDFLKMYPMEEAWYKQCVVIEQELFRKSAYIGSDSSWYRSVAHKYNPTAHLLRYHYCSDTDYSFLDHTVKKEFDFVYYAANISKAGEDAVKAFALAWQENHSLTLNLVGAYSKDFKSHLLHILTVHGVDTQCVTFSGYFPNHADALQQVLRSRFALVPIKIDIISGTVREAILLGLPVVTYITKGTPFLNKGEERVLLCEVGDSEKMAANMLRLVRNPAYADQLREKALAYGRNVWNSTTAMRILADTCHEIFDNYHSGTPFSDEVTECLY